MARLNLFASWFAVLLLPMLATVACSRTTAEEALRAQIMKLEQAVEARDTDAFLDGISEDFSGDAEAPDRRALRSLLAAHFLTSNAVSVVIVSSHVKMVEAERAVVEISAIVSGGRLLPERVESLTIESGWRLEGNEWRCYSARWSRDNHRR